MFIVNGTIKRKSKYNIYLGLMLSGVIIFNHIDFKIVHMIFALFFFAGNFFVIFAVKTGLFRSKLSEFLFDLIISLVAVLALVLFLAHVFTLFYLEWISFAMITVHYFLVNYRRKTRPARRRAASPATAS
jgi:hypothetical protein